MVPINLFLFLIILASCLLGVQSKDFPFQLPKTLKINDRNDYTITFSGDNNFCVNYKGKEFTAGNWFLYDDPRGGQHGDSILVLQLAEHSLNSNNKYRQKSKYNRSDKATSNVDKQQEWVSSYTDLRNECQVWHVQFNYSIGTIYLRFLAQSYLGEAAKKLEYKYAALPLYHTTIPSPAYLE